MRGNQIRIQLHRAKIINQNSLTLVTVVLQVMVDQRGFTGPRKTCHNGDGDVYLGFHGG